MNITIVGTGYVGLVSAACFSEMGNHVTCVDKNMTVVQKLKVGEIHIFEPGLEDLVKRNHKANRLIFTNDLPKALSKASVVFICVGTPSKADGSCDLSYVAQVAKEIGQNIQHKTVIVDKSTVPVGTADMVQGLIAEELAKRQVNIDFDVVSNPEFLKEGDAVSDFMKPDRVVLGTSSDYAKNVMRELYSPFARTRDKIIIMSVRSAEMTKYAANCMLATKISFINEIATICEQVGANVQEVRTGIGSDSRIGYQFIYPGLGYGGSCFPKDVKALIDIAKSVGVEPRLLKAVEEVNAKQKLSMALRIIAYFEALTGSKDLSKISICIWGIAFKANTDDIREAPALTIIEALTKRGIKVQAYDPEASANAQKHFAQNTLVNFYTDQYACLENCDALLVATEWNMFRNPDFDEIKAKLKQAVLFDGRNLYNAEYLKTLGFNYFCIGQAEKANKS